ncbi:MAG: pyrimidine 5'-nucleotidase [Pseudomonadota bacterium]
MAYRTWIFDLDNTLYPARLGLVEQINQRMTDWVMRELGLDRQGADTYRARTWREYGITLRGLIAEHGTDAAGFLHETHHIDYSRLAPAPRLAEAVTRLPGRKIVHTNGARAHAERVLARTGLAAHIDALWAIEDADLIPKPLPEATARILIGLKIDPQTAIMLDDSPANLAAAKDAGITTVWMTRDRTEAAPHIDHKAGNPVNFLAGFIS